MRQVIVRFIQDPKTQKFRVEVSWSPVSKDPVENAAVEVFRPALDSAIRTILPNSKLVGYGEGTSMEEARARAFIERDIAAADKKEDQKQQQLKKEK